MRVDLFDFDLPEENIALRPVEPRDQARFLVVGPQGDLQDKHVLDLPMLLQPGDALVFNNTKVIPSRLYGYRIRAEAKARVELMLHKRQSPDSWLAFARPAKKLNIGDVISFGTEESDISLSATVVSKGEGGEVSVQFSLSGPEFDQALMKIAELPLPPYIAGKRPTDGKDSTDYQTIYAKHEGAVAAPTAGLHFTDRLMADLAARGIEKHFVTLHVGAGTFLPVKVEETSEHRMHSEWGEVSPETAEALNAVRKRGGRVVAVGTTALRLLESAASDDDRIQAFSGDTAIFITPGYRFKAVDILMTNFHLPKSTLFMLVSAFSGMETMQKAYAHAIANGYRFYSYGDSSLLFRGAGEAL
ncbi:tRNA preQ1(34) S-adenosylmethionine ribosyltransferase-isomerase QueA [Microvirga sp. W0021]|uniref:S-adenosylmethionine:tRNA ribosyltransferase-isomerase n=1 Tax=Hohaiivirga grylli TaxID=3133970 RepID=A0ABV0BJX6_9HYPH